MKNKIYGAISILSFFVAYIVGDGMVQNRIGQATAAILLIFFISAMWMFAKLAGAFKSNKKPSCMFRRHTRRMQRKTVKFKLSHYLR